MRALIFAKRTAGLPVVYTPESMQTLILVGLKLMVLTLRIIQLENM